MTSQEAKGSFMLLVDVKAYIWETGIEIEVDKEQCILIENYNYVPTEIIQNQIDEMEWRTMQSKVTTSIFGLDLI